MKRLLLFLLIVPAFAQVRVWQGTLTLPTYQEGDPDPNPPFDFLATTRFNYPYTLREQITDRRIPQTWRALFLENEYLKCTVLPDIGGHLYSCTDKLIGAELFYANPSIKKAQVGYRGAWAAFGIEFNFPVSHNWASMSPVDFATVKHEDGSASVWVANIDRVYGMQWRVELILRPGSTVLEQRVRLHNRSDLRHRFYWWNNAAMQVWDDSRILYPQRLTASHGFTAIDTWPVNSQGLDLSVYGNHTRGPVSQFAHATREPFMGVYHPRTKSGIVHFAWPSQAPGKKIWSWGVDAAGKDWRKALSDNESAYVEVQGGLFRNQETYAFLPPQETIEFSEYWIPVREIGGYARATLDAVVNFERGSDVKLGLNVTRAFKGAHIRVKDGDNTVFEETVDLTPARVFSKNLPERPKYSVELKDAAGRVLLAHTEGVYDMAGPEEVKPGPQPALRRAPPGRRSEADALAVGTDQELDGKKIEAWHTYSDALRSDPSSFALNKAAGRLAVDLKRFDEAAAMLRKAQTMVSNDGEIHYYLGLALDALGQGEKARPEFEKAQILRAFRTPASLQLARLDARAGRMDSALRWIGEANADSPLSVRGGLIEVALLRHSGGTRKARERLDAYLRIDPTNSGFRFENVKLGASDDALWRHLAADPDRVLDLVTDYIGLGFYSDALEFLAKEYPAFDPAEGEPGTVGPQAHPLIAYYRGYCRAQLGQSGAADFEKASALSTRYIFPSRPGAIAVLEAALAANPNDATAHFLLGNLWMSGDMVDRAVEEWQRARALNSRISTLHRNLGYVQMLLQGQTEQAVTVMREGLDVDRENPALYSGLNQALSMLGRPAAERVAVFERYPSPKAMPAPLFYNQVLSLAEDNRAAQARGLFFGRFFPSEEGGINVRQIWVEVELQRALSLSRAGRQAEAQSVARGLGKVVEGLAFTKDDMEAYVDTPRVHELLGEIESAAGDPAAARAHWEKATQGGGRGPAYSMAFSALAARHLGVDADKWNDRLQSALKRTDDQLLSGNRSLTHYTRGMLLAALGRDSEAAASFRQALQVPDRDLSPYLARIALANPPR